MVMKRGNFKNLVTGPSPGRPVIPPPVNLVPPTISGGIYVGDTQSATRGTWDSQVFAWQQKWQMAPGPGYDSWSDVSGASTLDYDLTSAGLTKKLRYGERARNAGGWGEWAFSSPSSVIQSGPLAISGSPVLSATQNQPYAGFTASASGGVAPYAYSLVGSWPAGIDVQSSTGLVAGTPTGSGSHADLYVRVTDALGATADLAVGTIEVAASSAPLAISGTPVTTANQGSPYTEFIVTSSGGTLPHSFALVGTWPSGMQISQIDGTSARIHGTPSQSGAFSNLKVRVTDGVAATADLTVGTMNVTSAPTNNIIMVRGKHTKASQGGVNMGQLLPTKFTATSGSFTQTAGTSGHWNLPTNGNSPTPNSTGVSAGLNGGPYVFDYSASDGVTTINAVLTINIDAGRIRPAYYYRERRNVEPAKSFTTKCFSVSTAAEFTALSQSDLDGATVLYSKGMNPAQKMALGAFSTNKNPPNGCLVTSEDVNSFTLVHAIYLNYAQNIEFYNIEVRVTNAQLAAIGAGAYSVYFQNAPAGSKVLFCSLGSTGDDPTQWPWVYLTNVGANNGIHFVGNTVTRLQKFEFTRGSNGVVAHNTFDRSCTDMMFFGRDSVSLPGLTVENNLGTRIIWDGSGTHPDTMQFSANMSLSDVWFSGNRFYLANSTNDEHGLMFLGNTASGLLVMTGDNMIQGNISTGLSSYGTFSMFPGLNASGASTVKIYSNASLRAINGVTGAADPSATTGGAAGLAAAQSGAQGKVAHAPDSTPAYKYNGTLVHQFPGHHPRNSAQSASLAKYDIQRGFVHGPRPPDGCAVLQGTFMDRSGLSNVQPDYSNPSTIEPNFGGKFDSPYTLADFSGMSIWQIDEWYREHYAPTSGGELDVGDGTVNFAYAPRRGGALAKPSKYGLSTASLSASGGTVTVTLSHALTIDSIHDIYKNGSGTPAGNITVPAGSTTANGSFSMTAGDSFVAKNDVNIPQASAVAA